MALPETSPITVDYPDAADLALRVSAGACRLSIEPVDAETWVTGTYVDPTGALPIRVARESGTVSLSQGPSLTHLPHLLGGTPALTLKLGTAKPFALTLETGAGENSLDLGGVPLTRLTIREGAVSSSIDFSAPNPQRMAQLDVNAAAAGVTVKNLANAGATLMTLQGGAAAYEFDFGGSLTEDAEVRIGTGMSSVIITVPQSVAAKISIGDFLGRLVVGDGFTKQVGAYWTQAAVEGKSPVLVIDAKVALGAIELRVAGTVPAIPADAMVVPV